MWCLHPDVQITRRGRLFMITDEDGELQWSGASFIAALEYLAEKNIMEVEVFGDEARYRMQVWPLRA